MGNAKVNRCYSVQVTNWKLYFFKVDLKRRRVHVIIFINRVLCRRRLRNCVMAGRVAVKRRLACRRRRRLSFRTSAFTHRYPTSLKDRADTPYDGTKLLTYYYYVREGAVCVRANMCVMGSNLSSISENDKLLSLSHLEDDE